MLKISSEINVALPSSDLKGLGGELKRLFMIEGEQGDAPGLSILYLANGVEFQRWELEEGNRYCVVTPDTGNY